METHPTNNPATTASADIDRGLIVEVPLLLRQTDLAKLVARADRRRMTAGQLLRQVVDLYLAAGDDVPPDSPINRSHGATP